MLMEKSRLARLALGLVCLLGGLAGGGCGYAIGPAFSPGVRTVSVPIFKSQLFRRGIEFQLTEAVQKELKLRGLQVAQDPVCGNPPVRANRVVPQVQVERVGLR